MNIDVRHGDCLDVLRTMPDNSVDAIVTDPPYGLSNTKPQQVADVLKAWVTGDTVSVPAKRGGFMGKDWDSFVPPPAVWQECLRVLKPGGHMAVFAGARTQDLMGLSIRLAGFEIRDGLSWIYGTGFTKSMDIGKAIEACAQAGKATPSTRESLQWEGWGTALKPAHEPVILARKPIQGTVAGTVLEWGTGGLNIDESRIPSEPGRPMARSPQGGILRLDGCHSVEELERLAEAGLKTPTGRDARATLSRERRHRTQREKAKDRTTNQGRLPSNVILGDEAAGALEADIEGASRFFRVFKYQAKAPKRERPVVEREDGSKIQHATVKPLALMEWLVTLVTPPGGTVLDPFAGTGTTLQAAAQKGFNSIGIEQSAEYIQLINQRLADAGLEGAA